MKNKGFILLECLIAMIILALTLDLLYQTVYLAAYIDTEYEEEILFWE